MKTSKDYLRSGIERVHLQEEVYKLYRIENLPLKDVMKKQVWDMVQFTVIFVPLRLKTRN